MELREGYVFANGSIGIGDQVIVWVDDENHVAGTLRKPNVDYSVIVRIGKNLNIEIDKADIEYIAKKENGRWKLMREATDGKA